MSQRTSNSIGIDIPAGHIIDAVKKMDKAKREAFLEELIAAASPKYLASIRAARKDYREGKVSTHAEAFQRR